MKVVLGWAAPRHIHVVTDHARADDTETRRHVRQYQRFQLALLDRWRNTVTSLRDGNAIDDTGSCELQAILDLEQESLLRHASHSDPDGE